MKKFALAVTFILAGGPAFAQAIPPEALDKEYENCIQQGGPVTPQKQAYCQCVRNKMAGWSMDTYVNIAKEVAANGARSPTLEAMTKECFNATAK